LISNIKEPMGNSRGLFAFSIGIYSMLVLFYLVFIQLSVRCSKQATIFGRKKTPQLAAYFIVIIVLTMGL